MAVPDPRDARLLALLADAGRLSIPELAARAGVDPREAALRLLVLSQQGLPLRVGVECDPRGLRAALSTPNQPIAAPTTNPGTETTWGPPQTSAWARGDRQPAGAPIGTALDGDDLRVQVIEVVDPADFLVAAAGHRVPDGERTVVVHTEAVNRGDVATEVPVDNDLVLVTDGGATVAPAALALSSRPAHRAGIAPGATAGGHTVFLLPEDATVVAVRWTGAVASTSLSWAPPPR